MSTPDGTPAAAAPRLRHGQVTDVGLVREANEDALLAAPPVFVVADGMGGHDGGEVASALAVEALAPLAQRTWSDPGEAAEAVDAALREAQQRVADYDAQQREAGAARFASGTTVVAAVLVEHEGAPAWLVSNLGDSRGYGFDGRSLAPLTSDHSLVREMLDAGTISAEEARVHAERHVVTRALGASGDVAADHVVVPVALGAPAAAVLRRRHRPRRRPGRRARAGRRAGPAGRCRRARGGRAAGGRRRQRHRGGRRRLDGVRRQRAAASAAGTSSKASGRPMNRALPTGQASAKTLPTTRSSET